METISSIYQVPDVVLAAWRKEWNSRNGFNMLCGNSRYHVPPSNKFDLWVWVRSNARKPRFRGRVDLQVAKD